MKFSINSTIIASLAALICTTSSSSMLDASAAVVADDNKSNSKNIISRSSISRGVAFHYYDQINNNKRHLQENETLPTCKQIYSNNTQLGEAWELYSDNYDAMMMEFVDNLDLDLCVDAPAIASTTMNISSSGSTAETINGKDCDFPQSIAGQDEFELACTSTALGAIVLSYYEFNCDVTIDGDLTGFYMQFPEYWTCFPVDTSCRMVDGET